MTPKELVIPEKYVTITEKHYMRLVKDSQFLYRLQEAGVDNWEGYHYGYGEEEDFINEEDLL